MYNSCPFRAAPAECRLVSLPLKCLVAFHPSYHDCRDHAGRDDHLATPGWCPGDGGLPLSTVGTCYTPHRIPTFIFIRLSQLDGALEANSRPVVEEVGIPATPVRTAWSLGPVEHEVRGELGSPC